jgi:hypothetical protein
MIISALNLIEIELDRVYWNKYQKELKSPFDNTAETYENNIFAVRAYYWGNDEDKIDLPNFSYKNGEFTVHWYKDSHRILWIDCKVEFTVEYLNNMVNDCFNALREDFEDGKIS